MCCPLLTICRLPPEFLTIDGLAIRERLATMIIVLYWNISFVRKELQTNNVQLVDERFSLWFKFSKTVYKLNYKV
jgi:hypothetical protein